MSIQKVLRLWQNILSDGHSQCKNFELVDTFINKRQIWRPNKYMYMFCNCMSYFVNMKHLNKVRKKTPKKLPKNFDLDLTKISF